MSTNEIAYGQQLPVPRRRQPAFGDQGPPPEVEAKEEHRGPLDHRTEALLGLAIVTPVLAAYGAIGYWLYTVVTGVL